MLIQFHPNIWYRLTNPPSNVLDVVNDAGTSSSGHLKLSPLGNYSGQFWQIRPHSDHDGTFELCTWFLGPSLRLGVDLKEKGVKKVKLQTEGGKWRIVPNFESKKFDDEGIEVMGERRKWDGTYMLIHDKENRQVCLDMSSLMGFRVQAGQCWSITPIEQISSEEFLNS